MRTRYRIPPPALSASDMVSELVAGAVTGVAAVRRMFIRAILLVAVVVGALAFAAGVKMSDYFSSPDFAGATNQTGAETEPSPTPKPSKNQRNRERSDSRDNDLDLRTPAL